MLFSSDLAKLISKRLVAIFLTMVVSSYQVLFKSPSIGLVKKHFLTTNEEKMEYAVESGYLHSQLAKLLYAIKRIMRLSKISTNKQIGLEFTTLVQ